MQWITAHEARALMNTGDEPSAAEVGKIMLKIESACDLGYTEIAVRPEGVRVTLEGMKRVFEPLGYAVYPHYRKDVVISWKETEK